MGVPRLTVHEVDARRWKDFERLFEARGGPKYCWCMWWRMSVSRDKFSDTTILKAAISSRVKQGIPIGLLGYADGEPVAWCSIAPRPSYRRLVRDQTDDERVWSIACFFIVRRLRGSGIMKRMIAAAVSHARKRGAKVVEAYPVDADSPSYRFMGFVPVFEEAGFLQVGREGSRRHVMQRKLR